MFCIQNERQEDEDRETVFSGEQHAEPCLFVKDRCPFYSRRRSRLQGVASTATTSTVILLYFMQHSYPVWQVAGRNISRQLFIRAWCKMPRDAITPRGVLSYRISCQAVKARPVSDSRERFASKETVARDDSGEPRPPGRTKAPGTNFNRRFYQSFKR